MKVVTLHIENFMAIGSASLMLMDRGLNLIQGQNLDDTSAKSNGSGKSSIPDALSWCLFGETARGESGDAVVNRSAGKNCRVSVTLADDDGTMYRIDRYRRHSEHKNKVYVTRLDESGKEEDLTLGTDKLTQGVIEKILGCNLEVFNAAIYAGQERMPNLPGMTDKELKALVEEAAGINELEACYEEARTRARLAKAEVTSAEVALGAAIAAVEDRERLVEMAKAKFETWLKEQAEKITKLEKEREAIKNALEAEATAVDAERGKLPAYRDELEKLTSSLKARETGEAEIKKIDAEILALERKLSGINARLKIAADEVKKHKTRLDTVSERIGKPCRECGAPITEASLSHAIASAKSDLAESVRSFKEHKEGREKCESALSELRGKRESAVAALVDVSETVARINELQRKIREVEQKITDYKYHQTHLTTLEEELERARAAPNPFEDLVKTHEKDLEEVKARVKEYEEKLGKARERLELAEQAVEVFSPAGVRGHILDQVTPFLNTRTAHYLGHLSDGNITATWSTLAKNSKGELKEKFGIEVRSATGGDRFGLLSGGEKRKVRLACAMALQDLVAQRALKSIKLFMADEIDDALDDAGMERLMDLLNEKAKERGTVLVISHNELSDWIRDQTLVVKKDGRSFVEGALAA